MNGLGRRDAALAEIDRACAQLAPLDARLELAAARALRTRLASSPGAKPAAARNSSGLTSRELEVLKLIAGGLSNQAIAQRLRISEHTVHRHVANTLSKLDVPSRSAAVGQALRRGLL